MNNASTEARLLRGLLQVILDADFTPDEARAAVVALKDRDLFAPIIHVLESLSRPQNIQGQNKNVYYPVILDRSTEPKRSTSLGSNQINVDQVFHNVKRRKVSKPQLFNMFDAVNSSVALNLSDQISIRESLAAFKSMVSDSEWNTLNKIIEGKIEFDPFLRGMLKT